MRVLVDAIVEKLAVKHCVEPDEAEKALHNKPKLRFVEKGDRLTKVFTRW
ncbi:hypothetical protein H6F88_03005 [Oculatella sp. FACHB-28]|nr:hypothetical protein [Oculatella sp. FACHB-28]MBD2054998.1 hypothetical protein [Oculatella sp. FACHB-28]